MAADEALLLAAAESGVATLRFYQWSRATLSLGYFQSYDERRVHPASQECAIVRRQTGGGAILHDRDLTYSLVLPATNPLARRSQQLYAAIHDAFIEVLSSLVATPKSRWTLRRLDQRPNASSTQESFMCFARRACGDVLLVNGNDNQSKLLGSAQRRHRGAILQHGSLLVERSPFAPELAGWLDLTGVALSMDRLIDSLTVAIVDALALRAIPGRLPFELQSNADQLANTKYGHAAWIKRR